MYFEHLLSQVKFFFSSLSIYMHISFLRNTSVAPNLQQFHNTLYSQNYFYKNDSFILMLYKRNKIKNLQTVIKFYYFFQFLKKIINKMCFPFI